MPLTLKFHQDLTTSSGIHIPYSFTYASREAREATIGYSTSDVGKFARQLDNNSIWMLTSITPISWMAITGVSGVTGDMLKSTYDTNGDGIVNNSDLLDGHDSTFFSSTGHIHTAAEITYTPYEDSTADNVQEELNHLEDETKKIPYVSAGIWTSPTVTASTGIITIGTGEYLLYNDSSYEPDSIDKYTVSGETFTIPNDETQHYIVVDYNGGTPQLQLIDNVLTIDQSDIIPILTVYNLLGTILYLYWDEMAKGLSNKLCHRLVKTERFVIQPGGLILSERTGRYIHITSGTIWFGACSALLPEVLSSSTGQYIALYYHSGGVWNRTTSTTYNNTQYDDGSNLQTLSTNRYCVNWIYRGFSQDPTNIVQRPVSVLGLGDYKLAEALESSPPDPLPPAIANFCTLVGRIIVKNGDTTATSIDTIEEELHLSSITLHNGLSGLQGGTTDEYYHLTSTDYTRLTTGSLRIRTATTTDTILSTDDVILCNGTFTITLPASTGSGKVYNVKNIGTGITTLEGNLSETIDGELNISLDQYEGVTIIDSGTGVWYIL